MRICIPVEGTNGLDEKVYSHFGSSPYFLVYNTETKEIKTIQNNNDHHIHGACQPTGLLEAEKISAVISSGMGRNAVLKLNNSGVKVYVINNDNIEDLTVEKAIQLFQDGKFIELTVDMACHGHGERHGHH